MIKFSDNIKELIHRASNIYGIDTKIIAAIIMHESSGNPYAIRFEPLFYLMLKQHIKRTGEILTKTELISRAMSWGLMQVMGQTARELGFKEPYLAQLCDPWMGIFYGCKYFEKQFKRYGNHMDAIAAYNAGSVRKDNNGEYKNKKYVKTVLRYIEELNNGKQEF